MKNNKLTKIAVLILSLAVIMGAALGITAAAETAEETQTVEIAGYNVSYGGAISIVYAVKADLTEGQYIKIKGSAYNPVDETTENFSQVNYETPDYDIVVNGTNFGKLPMFYTPGIPLKNMATVVTAEAVICNADGTEVASSGKVTYSVLEYLYQRQYMYADSNTAEQKSLYELMLKTGEAVQAALNNYGADHAPSKYAYVNVSGGSFGDGNDSGIVLKGSSVTLTGNSYGFDVTPVSIGDDLAVVEGDTESVYNNGSYTVNSSVIVTARTTGLFEFGKGPYYSGTYAGTRYDFSDETQMNATDPGTTGVVSITDGIEKFGKTGAGNEEYICWNYNADQYNGYTTDNSLVFEADLMFSGITSEETAFSKIVIRDRGEVKRYTIAISEVDDKIRIGSSTYVEKEEWNNITIVGTPDEVNMKAIVDIYVNGTKTATEMINAEEYTSIATGKAHLYLYSNETGSIYIDNVFTGYTLLGGTGEYYSNSTISGKRYDFTDGTALPMFNSSADSTSTVVDGVNVVEVVGATSGDYPQFVFGNQDTSGFANKCAVFETDIMFNNLWTVEPYFEFRISGYNGVKVLTDVWSKKAMYITSSSANGICLYANRWYNLRFEIYETETAGSFNIKIYLNGEYKYTATATGTAKVANDMLFRLNSATTGAKVYFDNIFFDYVDKAYVAEE